ncbi:MAG: hypothetical protein IPO81_30695 [Kouleothrix sp.]|nr:hypothetical protein [Kouleothrix sp.]
MSPMTDTPTIHEWAALIQRDPAEAKRLLIALKARNKMQGLLAGPSLTISIEAYAEAQQQIAAATRDPAEAERLALMERLGQALLGPYPDRDAWLALLRDDPAFAHKLWLALRARAAMLGLQAPQALLRSIELYDELKA